MCKGACIYVLLEFNASYDSSVVEPVAEDDAAGEEDGEEGEVCVKPAEDEAEEEEHDKHEEAGGKVSFAPVPDSAEKKSHEEAGGVEDEWFAGEGGDGEAYDEEADAALFGEVKEVCHGYHLRSKAR